MRRCKSQWTSSANKPMSCVVRGHLVEDAAQNFALDFPQPGFGYLEEASPGLLADLHRPVVAQLQWFRAQPLPTVGEPLEFGDRQIQ